jgi:hypothetical protein
MNEFAVFKRFNDPDQVNELAETLILFDVMPGAY